MRILEAAPIALLALGCTGGSLGNLKAGSGGAAGAGASAEASAGAAGTSGAGGSAGVDAAAGAGGFAGASGAGGSAGGTAGTGGTAGSSGGTCNPAFCPSPGGAGCCVTPNGPCGTNTGSRCLGPSCTSSADCVAPLPYCDSNTNTCVQCAGNSDCPTGQTCSGGVCG